MAAISATFSRVQVARPATSVRAVAPASGKVFLSGAVLRTQAPALRTARAPVQTEAFFNFGKNSGGGGGAVADKTPYICIDCGYIYRDGDFKKLPRNYKCPTCDVGKNRFKPYGAPGAGYSSMAAQKKANKLAMKNRKPPAIGEKGGARAARRAAMIAENEAKRKGKK
mmetsp:Transcript_46406/g.148763  ORF Transcript_46406/g.148763 Transcript_46406/m.148763 type:complete len:168 (+) Transcript_46406:1291-1794(+)